MDGSRQRSTGDMARIMRHGRRCANVDRAVSTEVDESNGHFRAENHEHPVGDGPERVATVIAVDQTVHSGDLNPPQSPAYTAWIIPADHPKSPCMSP